MSKATRLTFAHLEQAPESAARILQQLEIPEIAGLLADVPTRLVAPVLNKMLPLTAARCLAMLPAERSAAIFRQMDYQDMTTLLRLMSIEEREAVCRELPGSLAARVERSLHYSPSRVGAWLEPDVAILNTRQTVGDALSFVQQSRPVAEIFIESADTGRYAGTMLVKTLLGVEANTPLELLSMEPVRALSNLASLKSVAFLPAWETCFMLPVVGRRQNVLGGLSLQGLRRGIGEYRESSFATPHSPIGELAGAFVLTASEVLSLLSGGFAAPRSIDSKES